MPGEPPGPNLSALLPGLPPLSVCTAGFTTAWAARVTRPDSSSPARRLPEAGPATQAPCHLGPGPTGQSVS